VYHKAQLHVSKITSTNMMKSIISSIHISSFIEMKYSNNSATNIIKHAAAFYTSSFISMKYFSNETFLIFLKLK